MTDQTTKKRGIRFAMLAQSFGVLGMSLFGNGVMLLYMAALGIDSVRIIIYLALPNAISILFRLPVAHLADKHGKKLVGRIGLGLTVLGFAPIPFAGSFADPALSEFIVVGGICVLALGKMLFAAGWFAMLNPLMDKNERGRVFGKLRVVYRIVTIIAGAICAALLTQDAPVSRYQIILSFFAFCFVARFIFYHGIPELSAPANREISFRQALLKTLRLPGYTGFCSYIFLLMLFTAGVGNLVALIEKKELMLGSGQVVFLANLTLVGGLLGHFVGGQAVDRIGTRSVFLTCHFGFAACLLGYVLRVVMPFPLLVSLGIVHFVFGLVQTSSMLAISTEILALTPDENKALATSLGMSLLLGGNALSGFMAAGVLNLDILRDKWMLFGNPMTRYDAILLTSAVMIVLLVVTLSLVPSVMGKAQWYPRESV